MVGASGHCRAFVAVAVAAIGLVPVRDGPRSYRSYFSIKMFLRLTCIKFKVRGPLRTTADQRLHGQSNAFVHPVPLALLASRSPDGHSGGERRPHVAPERLLGPRVV